MDKNKTKQNETKQNIREIKIEDFAKYYELINQFKKTELSKEKFEEILLFIQNTNMMKIWVIEDDINKKDDINKTHDNTIALIGSATIIYEQKFIHNGGKVAHIEDVIICGSKRGTGLGKKLIQFLLEESRKNNCYKTILNCDEELCDFYKKCGLSKKNIQMAKYF